MKKLALALALIMALTSLVCFAEETASEERTVLMTVGGVPLYLDEAEQISYLLYYYGYMEDYAMVNGVNYILMYDIAPTLLTEGKVEEILGNDLVEAFTEQHKAEYKQQIADYSANFITDSATEEEKAAALADAEKAYLEQGITEESYVNDQLTLDAFEVILASLDTAVTDEEVQAYYDSIVAQDEAYLGNNIEMFEMYSYMYGYDIFYQPEGYRGVLHILLGADQELLDAYTNAEDDEAKAEAAAAIIAFNQETIDTIYAELDAGATFEEEITKYNTDPGMTDPATLKEGYAVHAQSIYMVPEFTAGAFAGELQKPGDVGLPVVSQYGVHILYYLRDIPGGTVPMSAETAESIRGLLSGTKEQKAIADAINAYEVVYYDAYETEVGEDNFLNY